MRSPQRITIYQDAELQRRDIKKQVAATVAAPVGLLFAVCMSLAWAEYRHRRIRTAGDVAGKVGTQFGIEFRIDSAPAGDGVTLHLVLAFPPQGIRNPNTGDMMHAANIAFPNMKIGVLCVLGYGFDSAWEIVPGVWTEQIWYQDHMLAERTFTVSKSE